MGARGVHPLYGRGAPAQCHHELCTSTGRRPECLVRMVMGDGYSLGRAFGFVGRGRAERACVAVTTAGSGRGHDGQPSYFGETPLRRGVLALPWLNAGLALHSPLYVVSYMLTRGRVLVVELGFCIEF